MELFWERENEKLQNHIRLRHFVTQGCPDKLTFQLLGVQFSSKLESHRNFLWQRTTVAGGNGRMGKSHGDESVLWFVAILWWLGFVQPNLWCNNVVKHWRMNELRPGDPETNSWQFSCSGEVSVPQEVSGSQVCHENILQKYLIISNTNLTTWHDDGKTRHNSLVTSQSPAIKRHLFHDRPQFGTTSSLRQTSVLFSYIISLTNLDALGTGCVPASSAEDAEEEEESCCGRGCDSMRPAILQIQMVALYYRQDGLLALQIHWTGISKAASE